MSLIINIETATRICSVGLALDGKILAIRESTEKNIHASRVTVFIKEILEENGVTMNDLDAIAVSKGPGSYTGLRIGVSVAKGLCYALDIPLIAISTLQAMAAGAVELAGDNIDKNDLLCPMIDARRMEVYSALFDAENGEVRGIEAEIIEAGSLSGFLADRRVWFFGDGAEKCREVLSVSNNALFLADILPAGKVPSIPSARYLAKLSYLADIRNEYADVAYFEPYYLKDFIAGIPRVKGLK